MAWLIGQGFNQILLSIDCQRTPKQQEKDITGLWSMTTSMFCDAPHSDWWLFCMSFWRFSCSPKSERNFKYNIHVATITRHFYKEGEEKQNAFRKVTMFIQSAASPTEYFVEIKISKGWRTLRHVIRPLGCIACSCFMCWCKSAWTTAAGNLKRD